MLATARELMFSGLGSILHFQRLEAYNLVGLDGDMAWFQKPNFVLGLRPKTSPSQTEEPPALSTPSRSPAKIFKDSQNMREEEIEKLRGVVRDCVSKHLYSSAIFFADKVAAFTSDPADIYMQAQALFLGGHFRRAFHLLNASQVVLRDLRFRYLAAKCLEELKEWDQCLLMLGDAKVDEHGYVSDTKDCNVIYLDKDAEDREINILSAICFLRGKAYEALENHSQARQW
ncbi:unnamed protein product [Ilex paraguariensis]|uniref:Anaphase-promoting complex subunit 6 n=1 Tax=Ilex paraguariensis TaxID=185542 RepID=A0ABC8QND5_9AQUA